jgi:hypothetical protein
MCSREPGSELFGSDCWCSKGYYSENGRAPCNMCDDGSSSNLIGGRLADCKCHNGFYSNTTGLSPCSSCPENTESKIPVGATSCTCKVGYIGQGDEVPSNILAGITLMYKWSAVELHDFYSSRSFSLPCSACPANSGTWDASSKSLLETQGNKCFCDPDSKSISGLGPCEPCPEGSGSITLLTECYGLTSIKSYAMTKCFCKAGYYSPDGTGTDSGGDCIKCPLGKTSTNSELSYIRNYYCRDYDPSAGFGTLNKKCVCTRNYYKNTSVTIKSIGNVESSDDCLQCPEGSSTTDYDGTSCTICDIGYYSPTGLVPCAKCPDGMTTNGYQQTSCTVTSTYAPTAGPTASPTPSSPSITNAPIALPTRAPARSKRPTAQPTMRPIQANACPQGKYHQS